MEAESIFLSNIIKEVVDNPDKVEVTQSTDKMGVKLILKVDSSDMSKIIGSKGKMATALRTIIHAYGGKNESRIGLVIDEPEGSQFRNE